MKKPRLKLGVRSAVIDSADFIRGILKVGPGFVKIKTMEFVSIIPRLFAYSVATPSRQKGKESIVNIENVVRDWTEAIALMSTAHEPDQLDGAEALLDDSLHPILGAPVKQIREFYAKLVESLKADQRIPWFTVKLFESYEKLVVRNCEDQGIIRLKKKLAAEIVDMAEETVRPQLGKAMADALMWRSAEKLEALKERLESGERPAVRGRQSCLFLEAGKGKKRVSVML